jgi:hypothetical protein
MPLRTRWHIARATGVGATGLAAAALAVTAAPGGSASASAASTGPSTLPERTFASATASTTNPDDITRLADHTFVGFQNGVGPDGTPGPLGPKSPVVEYRSDGTVVHTFSLTGFTNPHGLLFVPSSEKEDSQGDS